VELFTNNKQTIYMSGDTVCNSSYTAIMLRHCSII